MATKATAQPPLKAEDVCRIIEQRIFSGTLPPGGKVNEKGLADELGISRAPVREAMSALRHEGLIDIIPNRGGFVRNPSMKEVLDCYDVRGGLAHTAGRLLPTSISREQLEELRRMREQMEDMLHGQGNEQDIRGYYEVNTRFHSLLFRATGNRVLMELNRTVQRKLALHLHREMSNPGVLAVSNREHLEIVERIASGDAEGVAAVFERHILRGKERLLAGQPQRAGDTTSSGHPPGDHEFIPIFEV